MLKWIGIDPMYIDPSCKSKRGDSKGFKKEGQVVSTAQNIKICSLLT